MKYTKFYSQRNSLFKLEILFTVVVDSLVISTRSSQAIFGDDL